MEPRGGLRAFAAGPAAVAPIPIRSISTPRWERGVPRARRSERAPVVNVGPAALSAIHHVKTDPNWLVPPAEEITSPEHAPEPEMLDDDIPMSVQMDASLGRRILASLVDGAVIFLSFAVAVTMGAVAFGWQALQPQVARGFDSVVDGLIFGHGLVLLLAGLLFVLGATYATISHAMGGATLGKALLGLRVVTQDGESPRWSDSAWRSFLSSSSLCLAGLGIAATIVDPERIALHDRLIGTRVVRVIE